MQTTDIVLLMIILIPGLVGILYGFLNIIFSIVAWLLAFAISFKFGAIFEPMLVNYIDNPIIRNILAFAGLFLISLMLLSLLSYFIVKLLGRAGLTAMDRMLGFFLGIGLGCFVIAAGVFMTGFTAFPEASWWQTSIVIEPFETVAIWGQQFLPEDVSKYHDYGV